MMDNTKMGEGMVCRCWHHKVMPVLVVLFGLTFLLGALGTFSASFVAVAWPVLVIVVGLWKLSKGKCKCC